MSLNGTRQLNDDIIPSLRSKRLLSPGQIIRPADIEPLAVGRKSTNLFALRDQSQHEIGKIQIFSAFNVLHDPRLVDVNAHAYVVNLFRLLAISRHAVVTVELEHAKIDFHATFV